MSTKIIVENKEQFEQAERVLKQFTEAFRKTIDSIEKKWSTFEIKLSNQYSEKIIFYVPKNTFNIEVYSDHATCYGTGFSIIQPKEKDKMIDIRFSDSELNTSKEAEN